jgi:hypothetical protein
MTEHHRLHPGEGVHTGSKGLKQDASGFLLLGVLLMVIWRLGSHKRFFGRERETVDPEVAAGRKLAVAAVPEEAVT